MTATEENFASFFAEPSSCCITVDDVNAAFGDPPDIPVVPWATPALVAIPAPGGSDPLVRVSDSNLMWLAAWWRNGWTAAVPTLYLRQSATKRLLSVAASLHGPWSLVAVDGWRPTKLQDNIHLWFRYQTASESPAQTQPGSFAPHVTGGAVDVTLAYNNTPLTLGDTYMDFGVAAQQPDEVAVKLQRALYWMMNEHGFCRNRDRWWQYEFGTSWWATVTNCEPLYGEAGLTNS